jgi:hypothetical protein
VAAGLPLTGATVRVLDPTGKAIASAKPVTASTGAYGPITLTGTGTFRVEACGTLADKPMCVWGLTNNGGTLHLTPMSSAIAVLASGQSPETLMTGSLAIVADTGIASAQTQLRAALAPALADAGLASDFDLLAGALTPGTHTGYDRVLDTVGVALGADSKSFVSLTARLGTGTAYLESGSTQGTLAFDAAASSLDLAALDAMFAKLVLATANNTACQSAQSGLATLMDASVRSSIDPYSAPFTGPTQASQVICLRLNGVLGDGEVLYGGKLLPSTLGRCSFGGGDPVCRVDFIYQNSKGLQRRLGVEQVAVKRTAGWALLGNRLEVQATANARLVRTRRVDSAAPDAYARYLDVSIPAIGVTGGGTVQCARVLQKDSSGNDVPLALFKKAGNGSTLSLWSVSATDSTPSLDPFTGATRGTNITGIPISNGADGDAIARNLARAGRALTIELYGDSACGTALTGQDGAAISVDVAGLLPIAATSQSGQPWPALAAASTAALASLKGAVNAKISYGPIWTYARGGLAVTRAALCTDNACATKLNEVELAAGATGAALSATLGNTALADTAYKLLRITGRTQDGLVLQLDSQSCSAQTPGLPC